MRRWFGRLSIGLTLCVSVGLIGALLALRSDSGRGYLARTLSRVLSQLLVGQIEVGSVRELSGGWVVLGDVACRDADGKLVVRARRVEALLNLGALLDGKLILEKAKVDTAWVSLHWRGDTLAIAETFLPVPSAEPKPPPATGERPFYFAIRQAIVRRAVVVEVPAGFSASHVDALGALSYSAGFRMQLSSLRGAVEHGLGARARLRVDRAALRVVENESSNLEAQLELGRESLRLQISTRWGAHGPARGRAALRGSVSAAGLSAVGLEPAAQLLRGELAVRAGVHWDDTRTSVGTHVRLDTEGGALTFEATRAGQLRRARLRAGALELGRVLAVEGLAALAFDLELEAVPGENGSLVAALHAQRLSYDSQELPSWTARARLTAQGAHLYALELPSWQRQQGKLELDVRADYAGDVQGSFAASAPRIAPGSGLARWSRARSSALRMSAKGSYRAKSDELHVTAAVQVARLLLAGASVAALDGQLHLDGALRRPTIAARASARGLARGEFRIDVAELEARGGPEHYKVQARATAGKARASAELSLTLGAQEQRLSGSGAVEGWFPEPLTLRLGELRVRPDAVELSDVRASVGESLLALEGRYGRTRDSDLHLRAEQVALAISTRAGAPAPGAAAAGVESKTARRQGLFGRAAAHLHLTGRAERPALDATLRIGEISFDGSELGVLVLAAALDSARSTANASLSLTSPAGDGAQLTLHSQLAAKGSLWTRLAQAHHELSVQGKQDLQNLGELWRVHEVSPSPSGRVELSGRLEGPLQKPEGQLLLSGTALALPHAGPFDARLEAALGAASTRLALMLSDAHGALARLSAEVQSAAAGLHSALRDNTWLKLPAAYSLKLEERALAELPAPLQSQLPVRVGLQAQLSTEPHAPPHASLSAQARYAETGKPSCPGAALPSLRLSAQLDQAGLSAVLSGELDKLRVLDARLTGPATDLASFDAALLARDLTLALRAHDIDLARLPGNCGAASGKVALSLNGRGLLAQAPELSTQVDVAGFRLGSAPALDVSLSARADRSGLSLAGLDVRQASRRALHAEGRLPWRWDGVTAPSLDLSRCRGRAELSDLPLATVLAAVPGIAQPSGALDGKLDLQGCGEHFDARGQLTVKEAAFTLKDPLVRVDGLSANLRLRPQALELDSFRLADQDGVLRGSGRIELAQGRPTRAALTFTTRAYPLRSDANVVAYVDGKVDLSAVLNQNPRRVRIALSSLSVSLPARGTREAQGLTPHADVVYVESALAPLPAAQGLAPQVPLELELEAREPFWVRREDFGVQLETHLRLSASSEGSRVSGSVIVRRGFINVLSKGFDIERGELLFDGGETTDPTVTLDAVHKLGDGQTVTIRIRNRLSAPAVTFATSVPGVSTDAEILQLLVRGRDSSAAQTAQAQVGAALAGLTSGLFGSLSRTKFGKYVPVLSLEAGASSGTRMRAGVEADALIPKRLRSVVEGAYVEGFVGSRNQGGNAQATGGVLMELYFPKDVVTGGTWELPNNWSVEATWEP